MIPPITDRLIEDAIQSTGMVRSGQAYWAQNKVRGLEIDLEAGIVRAEVRGSTPKPYRVILTFAPRRNGADVEARCTCPVYYGCKHCAATLFGLRAALHERAVAVAKAGAGPLHLRGSGHLHGSGAPRPKMPELPLAGPRRQADASPPDHDSRADHIAGALFTFGAFRQGASHMPQ